MDTPFDPARRKPMGNFGSHLARPFMISEIELLEMLKQARSVCLRAGGFEFVLEVENRMGAGEISTVDAIGILQSRAGGQ